MEVKKSSRKKMYWPGVHVVAERKTHVVQLKWEQTESTDATPVIYNKLTIACYVQGFQLNPTALFVDTASLQASISSKFCFVQTVFATPQSCCLHPTQLPQRLRLPVNIDSDISSNVCDQNNHN